MHKANQKIRTDSRVNRQRPVGELDPALVRHDEGTRFSRVLRWIGDRLIAERVMLLALGHVAVFLFAYWLAFGLRFDFAVPPISKEIFWKSLPWVLTLKLGVFYFAGNLHGWWRYVTFADLTSLLRAALLSLFVIAAVDHFLLPFQIPRVVLVLDCLMSILVLGSLRASWRLVREHFWPAVDPGSYRSALLVGADHNSGLLAHQIQSHSVYRIRGFLDIDGSKRNTRMGNIPILGLPEEVGEIAASCGATEVLVTAGGIPGKRLRHLVEICREADLQIKIIPPVHEIFNGDHRIPVRDIEINDLLRREPVQLDSQAIDNMVVGRTVMVTGAGGSIGSEISRQVMKFKPSELLLVDQGENGLFLLDLELESFRHDTAVRPLIADITDQDRMRGLIERYPPDVIFHAAAHKHVPLMESNCGEAIKNNVIGTKYLADLADAMHVGSFVLISTDKAVNPTSVMGAAKQIAERYILALAEESSTRFVAVRFGNVLGSNGSVVPIFQEQIRRGGPITITDPEMRRFFMSIPEAAQLVLQAAAMGKGGEIFVLDMGEPVRVVDLAQDLIRLSGLPPDAIEITYTGRRPGEKLYEELYFDDETTLETSHPKLRAAYHRSYSLASVTASIAELQILVDEDADIIRSKLEEIVPEFRLSSQKDAPRELASGTRPTGEPSLPSVAGAPDS